MSQIRYEYMRHEKLPYKPGFESFKFKFNRFPEGNGQNQKEEVELSLRISDTLIGQWDLEENPQDLEKAMFIYLLHKRLKNNSTDHLELNAYETPSPNQFPYKLEMDDTVFPPTEPIIIESS